MLRGGTRKKIHPPPDSRNDTCSAEGRGRKYTPLPTPGATHAPWRDEKEDTKSGYPESSGMTNLAIRKLFAFPHPVASPTRKKMTKIMQKFYDIPVMHFEY